MVCSQHLMVLMLVVGRDEERTVLGQGLAGSGAQMIFDLSLPVLEVVSHSEPRGPAGFGRVREWSLFDFSVLCLSLFLSLFFLTISS